MSADRPTHLHLRLSGLSDEELATWNEEIRRVGALPGGDALEATDTLIWSLMQATTPHSEMSGLSGLDDLDNWGERHLREQISRVHDTAVRLEASLAAPVGLQLWDAEGLRREADQIGQLVDRRFRDAAQREIEATQREAAQVADEVEAACHTELIRSALTEPLHSAATVQRLLTAIERAAGGLQKKARLTVELQQRVRLAKARAARYRSQKKLDEAEVAAAGGSEKRAEKLRREAGAVLAQDWARAFPGEPPPLEERAE